MFFFGVVVLEDISLLYDSIRIHQNEKSDPVCVSSDSHQQSNYFLIWGAEQEGGGDERAPFSTLSDGD